MFGDRRILCWAACASLVLVLVGCGQQTSADVDSHLEVSSEVASESSQETRKASKPQKDGPVPIGMKVEAKGLNDKGTRIPVRVTGTKELDGSELEQTSYLNSDGSGLELVDGTYEVAVLGSPITSEGAVFEVPTKPVRVSVEDGKPHAEGSLTFKEIPAKKTSDAQISAALEVAKKDKEFAERADDLAKKATARAHKARTVNFRDFDLVLPVTWVDKVEFKEDGHEQWLEWNGWRMFTRMSDEAGWAFLQQLDAIELDDGVTATIHKGNDFMVEAKVDDLEGRSTRVYLQVADKDMLGLAGRNEDELEAYRALQASAAECSATDDPEAIAIALLRECVKGMALTGEPDLSAYTVDMGTYRFVLPKPWRNKVTVEEHGTQRWVLYGSDVLCMLGTMAPGSDGDMVAHAGVLDSFVRDDGVQAEIVQGENWTLHGKLMVGIASWPRISIVMPDAVRDKESRGDRHSNIEEFARLQKAVVNTDDSASELDVAKECLRACLVSVDAVPSVSPDRLEEFEQRRRAIDDMPNTDRRFAGNMTEMREAGTERLNKMLDLINDMIAYLGGVDRVDASQLDATRNQVDAMERPGSGNAYALDVLSARMDEADGILDVLFALAYAARG